MDNQWTFFWFVASVGLGLFSWLQAAHLRDHDKASWRLPGGLWWVSGGGVSPAEASVRLWEPYQGGCAAFRTLDTYWPCRQTHHICSTLTAGNAVQRLREDVNLEVGLFKWGPFRLFVIFVLKLRRQESVVYIQMYQCFLLWFDAYVMWHDTSWWPVEYLAYVFWLVCLFAAPTNVIKKKQIDSRNDLLWACLLCVIYQLPLT